MQKLILLLAFLAPGVVFAQAPVSKLGSGSLEERLSQLERVMDARNAAQMALLDQMASLQDEVAYLRGRTEEHAYQLEQILQRQREIYQEIERRLAAVQTQNTSTGSNNTTSTASTQGVTDDSVDAGAVTTSPADEYSDNLSENDAYDKAIRLVMEERRYDAAIPEFRGFIERFPNSTYVPNAHYWLGQLLYAEGSYDEAKKEFAIVVEQYGDSNKRADSMLKLGIVAQQQQQTELARSYFEKVQQEYPNSTPADLAAKRLDNL